jgi:hypothetical protein
MLRTANAISEKRPSMNGRDHTQSTPSQESRPGVCHWQPSVVEGGSDPSEANSSGGYHHNRGGAASKIVALSPKDA